MQIPPQDPVTGNTGTILDTQSYAWVLLDWIFTKLAAEPFFANFAVKRISSALPVNAYGPTPPLHRW